MANTKIMSGVTLAGGGPSSASASERALKLQTDGPHLVSMGGDRLSTSVTLHPLPQGRVTLGSGSGVDIPVKGTGVAPLHCHIENSEGVVTIYPLSENLSIDGVKVSGPTRLSQGVMLTIGRSNYMRFNHPAEAKLMKSVLPNPRISMAPINFEPADVVSYQAGKMNRKPPVAPRKSPRESFSDSGSEDPPSSIMTKVSKFEYLAAQNLKKSFSPKVFSSNVPTVNIPVKDVLGKDISSLSKNLPQSALNYSELNFNDKQQIKSSNTNPILTRKHQPQYVNVAINDVQKSVNNKVVIFENGCIPKTPPSVNFDHNNLSSGRPPAKNVNLNRVAPPSPSFSRHEGYQYYRSVTPSPVSNNVKIEHRRSGSLGELTDNLADDLRELTCRKHDAEVKRTQAHRERVREQEIEKVEQQRLEEILMMCAEYEKQISPVEKSKPVTPNRIITNGSLPRDKRHLGPPSPSYCSPPQSPLDVLHNELLKQSNHYENVTLNSQQPAGATVRNGQYENVDLRHQERSGQTRQENGVSSYENVVPSGNSQGSYPSSPRTRIKTFVTSNKSPKESQESLDNKYAVLETEKKLLREAEIVLRQNLHNFKEVNVLPQNLDSTEMEPRKSTPTKFIFPMEDGDCSDPTSENRQSTESRLDDFSNRTHSSTNSFKEYNRNTSERENQEQKKKIEQLKNEKKDILAVISRIKRQMTEVEMQEEELHREIELEKALINGEYKSKQLELEKIEAKKQKLLKRAQRIEESMVDCQLKQEEDQKKCKDKLKEAQEYMNVVDEKLKNADKGLPEYEEIFEEYLQAQEQLDNERKTFEDLEFHHLEEEADWLASREELQREIVDLSNKIEHIRTHIQDLEHQKHNTSKTNSKEYRTIERHKMECMVRLEEIRSRLQYIDAELTALAQNIDPSDREYSSDDSDISDRSKELDQHLSNKMSDLSVSMIVQSSRMVEEENEYNMSQSYNEKLFQEKSVLEGATKRFPSQDDIDRISKVTSDTPIIEERESLGRKTIESLKEIDRIRHLHLCQQGSQVIEHERQRMNALKQKVQEEVKFQWAQQQRQDSPSLILTEVNGHSNGDSNSFKSETPSSAQEENNLLREDSNENSRPMSEISEMSLEVGTLSRKRNKPPSDKQRPLTRYLPIRGSDLDLRQHIESAGHQVVLCPHVIINSSTCRGFLHKRGSKLNGWSRRWFVFDRLKHTLTYYSDKSEKKPRGGAYFQAIEEVYLDHLNTIKSPNPQLTFIVKTHERHYYLMAPSPEAMRIWVDVVFTGAEGYREFEHGT